uniref:Aa_trans domain-containing protein n=1 Tax=Haemonchus contortus TaxID=6289 RepID=A0A7I5E6P0_HAECO
MRVFYIIKALQITVAAIVIYRLLSVDELCDIRIIKSISSCQDTVTLFLPRHVSDHQVGTTNSVNSGQQRPQNLDLVSGSIGHHTILTHKDQGLEEVHDRNIKKEKQEEAVSSTNPDSQSPSSPTPNLGHTTNVQDQDGHTDLKTSVKPTDQPTSKVEHDSTAVDGSAAANGTTGVVKNVESSTASVTKNEHKQERSEGLEPVDEVENSTQSLLGEELGAETEELPTGTPVSVADKTNPKKPERKIKFRLKNTVHNCLPIHTADMLGFGSLDLSHSVALRVPIVCMIISMAGTAISVFHAFTNLSRPRKVSQALNKTPRPLPELHSFSVEVLSKTWHRLCCGPYAPLHCF